MTVPRSPRASESYFLDSPILQLAFFWTTVCFFGQPIARLAIFVRMPGSQFLFEIDFRQSLITLVQVSHSTTSLPRKRFSRTT